MGGMNHGIATYVLAKLELYTLTFRGGQIRCVLVSLQNQILNFGSIDETYVIVYCSSKSSKLLRAPMPNK